jgi:hypothetical protein
MDVGVFFLDVSNHQGRDIDWAAVRREGYEAVYIKCGQGDWFRDGWFRRHAEAATAAGLAVAAYHYQETQSPASQVNLIMSVTEGRYPVIPDVEDGSGHTDITRGIVDGLRARGVTVPWLYLPKWYWQKIGSPNIAGLPPLIKSWYPDNVRRYGGPGLALIPQYVWDKYTATAPPVAAVQFTSSGILDSYPGPLDLNFYPGTIDDLRAAWGAKSAPPTAPPAGPPSSNAGPWPLPAGHYFGLITGPAASHGGYYASERVHVQRIQQALQRAGKAPNVSGWADGKYEQATRNAVIAWQRSVGFVQTGNIWPDDWNKLLA